MGQRWESIQWFWWSGRRCPGSSNWVADEVSCASKKSSDASTNTKTSRYLPPLKGVLVSFNPSPSFEHPASQFNSAYSPFETPSASSSSRNDPSRLLMSPGREDEEEDAAPSQSVKLIAMPMIEGSGFALPVVRWNGVVWRPRVGQIVGAALFHYPLLFVRTDQSLC